MYGRETISPDDLIYGPPPDDPDNSSSELDFVARQLDILRRAYAFVRENLPVAAER